METFIKECANPECCETFEVRSNRHLYCKVSCRLSHRNFNFNQYAQSWQINNPVKIMLASARHRAKKNNLPFELTVEDIFIPEYCPILGIKMECQAGKGRVKDNSPSLDKIVPSKGYVVGNVQVISYRANRLKGDCSLEDLLKFADWVIETYRGETN